MESADGAFVDGAVADRGADFGVCGELSASAGRRLKPVDIIWTIDSSPSMREEIDLVQANLNQFTGRILEAGLDVRVVLVGSQADRQTDGQAFLGICIPPPLSGADQCPDVDSERYFHARVDVHSRDPLVRFVESYPLFQGFLREEAFKHMVFVTDDNSGWGIDEAEFLAFLMDAEPPGFSSGYAVHSVVDTAPDNPNCGLEGTCSCGRRQGQTYISLSQGSAGVVHSVCEEDWSPLFEALELHLFENSGPLPCGYEFPYRDDTIVYPPNLVNVYWRRSAEEEEALVPQVENAAACGEEAGWYYDDPNAPTVITLCPSSCGADEGEVRLEFGCEVVKR